MSSIEFFKKMLGRQITTKNYSCRNYIWTFSDDETKATLYCLVSKKGPSWECDSSSDQLVLKKLYKEANEYLFLKAKNEQKR